MAGKTSFVSLGGVWLDEIRRPNQPACKDVVGGSSTYATLGARLFNAEQPWRLTLVVNAGYDFPRLVVEELETWRVNVRLLTNSDKCSTRGILEHNGVAGSRFTRLTPPLLTSPADIATAGCLDSQVFHMFAVPDLVHSQCLQLKELRRTACPDAGEPIIIWEPHPKSCSQPLLKEHASLLHDGATTVFSPNHHELNSFFDSASDSAPFDRVLIEARARSFFGLPKFTYELTRATPGVQVIIIRAAENGCLILRRDRADAVWLPAYFSASQQDKVIDPTGAGNAFLGGLAQGWLETQDWINAACYGTIAASVIVESVGPPDHEGEGKAETWAGVNLRARLALYKARTDVRAVLGYSTPSV